MANLPEKYEVIKLMTGSEIVGMTTDKGNVLNITLPMYCNLTATGRNDESIVTFIPYSPLTDEISIDIPKQYILHQNSLNPQFISFYDEASSRWMTMVETQEVPVIAKESYEEIVHKTVKKTFDSIMKGSSKGDADPYFEEDYEEFTKAPRKKDTVIH